MLKTVFDKLWRNVAILLLLLYLSPFIVLGSAVTLAKLGYKIGEALANVTIIMKGRRPWPITL